MRGVVVIVVLGSVCLAAGGHEKLRASILARGHRLLLLQNELAPPPWNEPRECVESHDYNRDGLVDLACSVVFPDGAVGLDVVLATDGGKSRLALERRLLPPKIDVTCGSCGPLQDVTRWLFVPRPGTIAVGERLRWMGELGGGGYASRTFEFEWTPEGFREVRRGHIGALGYARGTGGSPPEGEWASVWPVMSVIDRGLTSSMEIASTSTTQTGAGAARERWVPSCEFDFFSSRRGELEATDGGWYGVAPTRLAAVAPVRDAPWDYSWVPTGYPAVEGVTIDHCRALLVNTGRLPSSHKRGGRADLEVEVRTQWDEENVRFSVGVVDDQVVLAPPGAESSIKYDHLEFWFIENRGREVIQLGLIPIAASHFVRVFQWYPKEEEISWVAATYQSTGTGYSVEVVIPRSAFAWRQRGDGEILNLDESMSTPKLQFELDPLGETEASAALTIAVSDADDPKSPRQEKLLASSSLGKRGDPAYLGRLHLLKKGAAAPGHPDGMH